MNFTFRFILALVCMLCIDFFNYCYAQKLDTSGLGKKLDFCYELNKARDEKLVNEAKKLLKFASAYPKSDIEVKINTLIARGFLNNRIPDSAYLYLKKCKIPFGNQVSYRARFDYFIALARVDYIKNSFNQSIENDLKAYQLAKTAVDKKRMAIALTNLANTNGVIGRLDQSLEYLEESANYSLDASDSITYAYTMQSIGTIYFQKNEFTKAPFYYNQTAALFSKYQVKNELILTYSLLADCYFNLKNYNLALKYVDMSNKIKGDYQNTYFDLYNSSILAKAYYKLNKLDLAVKYAELLNSNINAGGAEELEIDFLKICIEIYSGTKNYDKAIGLIKKYDSLTSSFTDSLKNAYAMDKEFDFRFSNVKAELKRIKEEKRVQEELNELQKKVLIMGVAVIILLIALLGIGFVFLRRNIENSKLLNQKNNQIEDQLRIVRKQNELQLLTIGIVGHDLRGPLSSAITLRSILNKILDDADINSAKELSTLLFDSLERINVLANNLVQWVLSAQSGINLNFKQVVIKEAIDNLIQVFETELAKKQIKIINQVNPTIEVYADAACVETILRNVIQNAIKFTNEGRNVTVSATDFPNEQGLITLTVKDEGVGMPPEILEKLNDGKRMITLGTKGEKGNGLGLIMIQTLLSLNKGKMQISSEVGVGTSFSVLLPKSKTS